MLHYVCVFAGFKENLESYEEASRIKNFELNRTTRRAKEHVGPSPGGVSPWATKSDFATPRRGSTDSPASQAPAASQGSDSSRRQQPLAGQWQYTPQGWTWNPSWNYPPTQVQWNPPAPSIPQGATWPMPPHPQGPPPWIPTHPPPQFQHQQHLNSQTWTSAAGVGRPPGDPSSPMGGTSYAGFVPMTRANLESQWPNTHESGGVPPPHSQVNMDVGGHAVEKEVRHEETRKQDSVKRASRRSYRKQIVQQAKERKERGLKPYLVVLNEGGEVDGASIGKSFWEVALRQYIPNMLDMSCIYYGKQDPDGQRNLKSALDEDFEFKDNTLDEEGYHKHIANWIIKERARLKDIYVKEKVNNRRNPNEIKCPPHIQEDQWEALKQYWELPTTEDKSEEMRYARSLVRNVNRTGRTGYAGKAAMLVSVRNPCVCRG